MKDIIRYSCRRCGSPRIEFFLRPGARRYTSRCLDCGRMNTAEYDQFMPLEWSECEYLLDIGDEMECKISGKCPYAILKCPLNGHSGKIPFVHE